MAKVPTLEFKGGSMSKLINEFIKCSEHCCGVGYFEDNELAVSYAQTMGTNQIRKFRRYGIIPAAFFKYLKGVKAIQENAWVPERARTVETLLDLLYDAPEGHIGEYAEGEWFREALLLEMFPELRNTMGSSQCVWQALEREGKLHRLEGPGGTAKMPDYLKKP